MTTQPIGVLAPQPGRRFWPSKQTLRFLLIGYLVKTAILGATWIVAPEVPQRAINAAQALWADVSQAD